MVVCQFCGAKLMEGAKFCYKCEKQLEYPDESRINGGMRDSVAMHSPGAGSVYAPNVTIGKEEKKYCQHCETPISEKNRSIRCSDCGKLFCAACELDFRTERKPGEKPYCGDCFSKHQELIRQERERREAAERARLAEEKKKESTREIIENSIGMKLKLIPAGEFMMGDSSKHKVKLTKPFYIGIYPVTQKEWQKVMGSNPSYFKGDDLPVEQVSWHDCQEFIGALNKKEGGWKYRLPTEAEWEYACRAGSTTRFCYGDDDSRLGEYAWYDANSNKKTHPVGIKRPNAWGLHDMHGNLWEWCEDWYGDYPSGEVTDPTGPSSGSARVDRGGSWNRPAGRCTSANRNRRDPANRGYYLGVRLARSL